jgi:predicted permease
MRSLAVVLRRLRREPLLSLTIAGTLALSIGSATALAVYLAAFTEPLLPAVDPARLVQVHFGTDEDPLASSSHAEYRAVLESGAFEAVASNYASGATVAWRGANVFAWGQAVTAGFFDVFGGRAVHGRLIVPADESAEGEPPLVLSNRLWRTAFASDPAVVGRSLELNGRRFTVVGVLARGFQGTGYASEWFVPLPEIDRLSGVPRVAGGEEKFLFLWALLPRDGAARRALPGRLDALARGLDAEAPLPDGERRLASVQPATLFGPNYRQEPMYHAARALTGATVLFLLLGAGNVSGLLLARATARDREWAVRKAMGAGPLRLAGAIVGEALPLVVLGLVGAAAAARLVLAQIESMLFTSIGGLGGSWTVEDPHVLHLDGKALVLALAAGAVALAVGAAPPLARVLRRHPVEVLRSDGARSGADRRTLAPRRLLVALEIALAVVLLVGGALLARTLRAYATADARFASEGLLLTTIYLPPAPGRPAASAEFFRDLQARAAELAGVEAATVASVGPNTGFSPRQTQVVPTDRDEGGLAADYNVVGASYLATLGVPIVAGRDLSVSDVPGGAPVVVVTETLARRLWGSADRAVGRLLRADLPVRAGQSGPEFEVVGVAADAGFASAAEPERPWALFAYGQRALPRMQLVVRSRQPLVALEPQLRDAVAAVRSDASVIDLVDAGAQLHRSLESPRLNARIAGGLALAGLATALIGLVALQLFTVNLRRRDLALRLALGATGARVARELLAESLRIAAAGAAIGLAAALAATRLMRSLLYGVEAIDPLTFAAVPLLVAGTVLLAAWLPARRAVRVDPAEDLRAL